MKVILDYEYHPEVSGNLHRITELKVKNYDEAFETAVKKNPSVGDELGGKSESVTVFERGKRNHYVILIDDKNWKPLEFEGERAILKRKETLEDYKTKLENDESKKNSVEIFEME